MAEVPTENAAGLPLWKRLVFSGVIVAGMLALLEAGARLYLRSTRGFDGRNIVEYSFDPYKNILPTPGFIDTRGIRVNSQGFRRDADVSAVKPDGTFRIFLMGASTAYGLGGLWTHIQREFAVIPDSATISAFLERRLQAEFPHLKMEVINAAITSTWTHHELIYLNQTILRMQPDMVLFLDGFNDFYFYDRGHDQFRDYSYTLTSREVMGAPTLGNLLAANGWWLYRKSAAVHLATRSVRNLKLVLNAKSIPRDPMNVDSALAGLAFVFPRNALKMHERIALILANEGIDAVFMLQPMLILERDRAQMPAIERRLFEFNAQSYLPNYEEFARRAVPLVVEQEGAMAARHGGHFIDLTGIFREAEGQMFTDYCHLTPGANRILADTVARRIMPLISSRIERAAGAADVRPR